MLPECLISAQQSEPSSHWHCLQIRPRHEHIAAAHLTQFGGIETLNPRIRFTRTRNNRSARVTESIFPGYLFARFDRASSQRLVQSAPGVAGIVHFGDFWPTLDPAIIAGLAALAPDGSPCPVDENFSPGDAVHVTVGGIAGLAAVVTRPMPARARVQVLLDFLGTCAAVELPHAAVTHDIPVRVRFARAAALAAAA